MNELSSLARTETTKVIWDSGKKIKIPSNLINERQLREKQNHPMFGFHRDDQHLLLKHYNIHEVMVYRVRHF